MQRERFGNIRQADVEGSRVIPGCQWEPSLGNIGTSGEPGESALASRAGDL